MLARDNPGFCTVHRFSAGVSIFVEERSLVLLLLLLLDPSKLLYVAPPRNSETFE